MHIASYSSLIGKEKIKLEIIAVYLRVFLFIPVVMIIRTLDD